MTLPLLLALMLPFQSLAGISESAAYANRGFHEVLLRCPERVWPGIDWSDLQFLFSDPENKDAWLISKSSAVPEIVRKDQTIEDIFEPGFKVGFVDYRGQRTVAVNTSDLTAEGSFRLAVHQLFKETAQSQWEIQDYDDRGVLYPLLPEPRYLRRMGFESLKKAYLAIIEKRSPKNDLAAAAWWLQRWRKSYPEELPMRTDSLEGTALFTEQMSFLFTEAGCGVGGDSFYSAYLDYLEPEMRLYADDMLSYEGMSLGSLSSFVLSSLQPGWFTKMNGKVMPSDLVLEGIRPEPQADDRVLRDAYREIVAEQQKQAHHRINSSLDKEKDKDYVRVSIPARWQKGELSIDLSYVLRYRLDTTLLIFDNANDFKGERGSIHIPGKSIVFQSRRNGCGSVFHFLMPVTAITQDGKHFEGRNWWHRFSFDGIRKTVNGFTWLCPRE